MRYHLKLERVTAIPTVSQRTVLLPYIHLQQGARLWSHSEVKYFTSGTVINEIICFINAECRAPCLIYFDEFI